MPVTGSDYSRLADQAEHWVTWKNNRAFMRMTAGHCAALQIEDSALGPQFVCSIYDQRPHTCRDLARGSPQCEADFVTKAKVV